MEGRTVGSACAAIRFTGARGVAGKHGIVNRESLGFDGNL